MSIYKKLLQAQREIEPAVKSSKNPHFRSNYANLDEVLSIVKPSLNKAGLVLLQSNGTDAVGPFVRTSVVDSESGEAVDTTVHLVAASENMQKLGAAITYARRYGLLTLFALETEDDDGETAVGRPVAQAHKPEVTKTAVAAPVKPVFKQDVLDVVTAITHKHKQVTETILLTFVENKFKIKSRSFLDLATAIEGYKRHDILVVLNDILKTGKLGA